jgi:hypothetical protein
MPVKRRHPKARVDDLDAWKDFFEFGYDMLHSLHPMTEEECLAAAPEAWKRLGARFLETWQPHERYPNCWALDTFGKPPCR